MILSEYVNMVVEESQPCSIITESTDGEVLDEVEASARESTGKWICKRLRDNNVYLFHDGYWINLTDLKKEMNDYYASKGYANGGYCRLSEEELINYHTVKQILADIISRSMDKELNPADTAISLYNREVITD